MENNEEFEFKYSEVPIHLSEKLEGMKSSINEIFNSFGPAFQAAQNVMEKLGDITEGFRETHKAYTLFMDKSAEIGWVSLLNWPLSYDFYSENNKLTPEELDELYLRTLKEDDYSEVFKLLDDLEYNLNSGYKIEVNKIKKILESDMSNYTLVIPHLYILLDYIFTYLYKDGDLATGEYMKERTVIDFSNKNKVSEEDHTMFHQLMKRNCVLLLIEHVEYVHFSTPVLNRHHVLHGRFDPVNYECSDFLKLLVLCSNLSWYFQLE